MCRWFYILCGIFVIICCPFNLLLVSRESCSLWSCIFTSVFICNIQVSQAFRKTIVTIFSLCQFNILPSSAFSEMLLIMPGFWWDQSLLVFNADMLNVALFNTVTVHKQAKQQKSTVFISLASTILFYRPVWVVYIKTILSSNRWCFYLATPIMSSIISLSQHTKTISEDIEEVPQH